MEAVFLSKRNICVRLGLLAYRGSPVRNITLVTFLLVLLLASANATPESFESGNELLSACKKQEGSFGSAYCMAYIAAVSDSHDTWVNWGYIPKRTCTPEKVTVGQLELVTVKYLEENPQELHLGASSLVLNALTLAFPCTQP